MTDHASRGAPPPGYQTVSPYLLYEHADRAVAWLTSLGFVERRVTTGAAGRSHHELVLGDDGLVMVGQMGPSFQSARTLGFDPPMMIHIYVDDVTALHQRAQVTGTDITDLEMSPAGDQRFTATDPEGIAWVFAQRMTQARR